MPWRPSGVSCPVVRGRTTADTHHADQRSGVPGPGRALDFYTCSLIYWVDVEMCGYFADLCWA